MMPDPATMKITTLGQGDEKVVDFYKKYYVAHWNFDDGAGNILGDSSGGNDGTCSGMGPSCSWTTGKYGSAVTFDGIDDYVNILYSSSLNLTNNFTVETWFKINSLVSSQQQNVIITRGGGPTDMNYRLKVTSTGRLEFELSNETVQNIGTSFPSFNQWHHVVGIYNGTAMKIYVDGTLNDARNVEGNIKTSSDTLYIGRQSGGLGAFFNGTIDEVRIMNIARPM